MKLEIEVVMIRENSQQGSDNKIGRLSEIIIEVLKEVSSQRRPLASSVLSEVLIKRRDLLELLSGSNGGAAEPGEAGAAGASDAGELKFENRTLRFQKERLLGEITSLEEAKNQTEVFCKRSLLTLTNWVKAPKGEIPSGPLDQFRELLLRDADLASLERALREAKDALLNLNPDIPREDDFKADSSSMWNRLFGSRKTSEEAEPSDETYLKHLQGVYMELLLAVPNELGKGHSDRLNALQNRIQTSKDLEQLINLKKEIVDLLHVSINGILEERRQITKFITEIGENLIQMESHVLSTLSHSQEAQQANAEFSRVIEGQMDDMKQSVDVSTTLAELKRMVITRMTTIRAALEAKRREDEQQVFKANQKLGGLQQKIRTVKEEIGEVQKRAKSLEREVLMDPLTNTYNRRAYEQRLREEFQRYHRYRQTFSMLLFDVDKFKNVNDDYGHLAGDLCLKEIINRIKPILRISDFLARYGGDEFVLLLPGTDREAMVMVAEKIRATIENTRFLYKGRRIEVRISVGGAQVDSSDGDEATLFNRADQALYEAKKTGRNRAVIL